MRKTDKKIDNKLRLLLTEVCDYALQHSLGYQWITHSVNYSHFPETLIITCMFEDKNSADKALKEGELLNLIQQRLATISVYLQKPHQQVRFESQ